MAGGEMRTFAFEGVSEPFEAAGLRSGFRVVECFCPSLTVLFLGQMTVGSMREAGTWAWTSPGTSAPTAVIHLVDQSKSFRVQKCWFLLRFR